MVLRARSEKSLSSDRASLILSSKNLKASLLSFSMNVAMIAYNKVLLESVEL